MTNNILKVEPGPPMALYERKLEADEGEVAKAIEADFKKRYGQEPKIVRVYRACAVAGPKPVQP